MVTSLSECVKRIIPNAVLNKLNGRLDPEKCDTRVTDQDRPSFDLVRASVNLMVASALISLGTSLKLPLSTTYVTFMVAMGTSFSDRAWGRDSAVYRVTGVFAVIGGWFLTALMAFIVSAIFAFVIFQLRAPAVLAILGLGIFVLLRNRRVHKKREKEVEDSEIFNLKKVKDGKYAITTTFEHTGYLLGEVARVLTIGYEGLAKANRQLLRNATKESKKIRSWSNIIMANIFKILRLLHKEDPVSTQKYAQAVSALQEIGECLRDAIRRSYEHVDNNHKGMLPVQLEEMKQVNDLVVGLLERTSNAMMQKEIADCKAIAFDKEKLKQLEDKFDKNQVVRIQNESSKTRLSILFYGFIRDLNIISEQTHNLMKIFQDSFNVDDKQTACP